MKNLLAILLAALCLAVALCGCSTVKISPALVEQGVATATRYSLTKYPQAIPEVKVAGQVICSAANGTDISPAAVVAALDAGGTFSPETVLIVNASLTLYIGIWDSYGAKAVANTPVLRDYLAATCAGIQDALPASAARRAVAGRSDTNGWPQVKFK